MRYFIEDTESGYRFGLITATGTEQYFDQVGGHDSFERLYKDAAEEFNYQREHGHRPKLKPHVDNRSPGLAQRGS